MTDAKTWLSRGSWLRREREQLERLREETMTRLTKTTATMSDAPGGGTKDPHKMDALATLDAELDSRLRELDKVKLEIFSAIQQLNDRRYRMVLLGRYYECLEWGDIATLMHYEQRQVYRIHGMALTAIQPIIERRGSDGDV